MYIYTIFLILLQSIVPSERYVTLQEVNFVRSKGIVCGDTYYNPVKPLTWNMDLAKLATNHASDMQQNGYFSHYSDSNIDVGGRAEIIHYDWMLIGENIAVGHLSELSVMQAWLASDEHCKMIVEPYIKEIGTARVGRYWVQNFGVPDNVRGLENYTAMGDK